MAMSGSSCAAFPAVGWSVWAGSFAMVGDVMVHDPVTVFPDMEVDDLRRLMIAKRSRYLPVMDGNTLIGVISFLDVAKTVLEERNFENKMLKNYIKNWPDDPQI